MVNLKARTFLGRTYGPLTFANAISRRIFLVPICVEGIFSASVMTGANLHGADLTAAMMNWIDFTKADLSDSILQKQFCCSQPLTRPISLALTLVTPC